MGELAERYLKYKEIDEEKKKRVEPDPATEGDKYIEFQRRNRREPDMLIHFRNDLREAPIPADKVIRAFAKAAGADRYRELLEESRRDTGVIYQIEEYMKA